MGAELEHANLWVRDLDAAVQFLTSALPEFRVRGGGPADQQRRWLHIGTDSTYLALTEAKQDSDCRKGRLNHLGFVVDDVEAVRQRLSADGYQEGVVAEPHPYRKRLYYQDGDGFEWEFVEYLTDDPTKRNEYST